MRPDINDDQRRRVWAQVDQRIETMGKQDVAELLPRVLGLENAEATTGAVLDAEDHITRRFPSRDERYELARQVLLAVLAAPGIETARRATGWIKRLDMPDVLNELDRMRDVTPDDVALLKEEFPDNKHLRKLKDTAELS